MSKVEDVIRQLQNQLEKEPLIDVGIGSAYFFGVSESTFRKALLSMKSQGYSIHYYMASKEVGKARVIVKLLSKSSMSWSEGFAHLGKVKFHR